MRTTISPAQLAAMDSCFGLAGPHQHGVSTIDLFRNGGQINYSFVLMLISPTNLAMTSKFQKNICFKTRAVGLININTKECKVGRHLLKWSIPSGCFRQPFKWQLHKTNVLSWVGIAQPFSHGKRVGRLIRHQKRPLCHVIF